MPLVKAKGGIPSGIFRVWPSLSTQVPCLLCVHRHTCPLPPHVGTHATAEQRAVRGGTYRLPQPTYMFWIQVFSC